MDINFISDDPNTPAFQKLVVGQPLPDFLDVPVSETAILHVPNAGLLAVARYADLQRIERRAMRNGRWNVGVMAAGPHATLMHVEFSLGGDRCRLRHDFAFSGEAHRATSGDELASAPAVDMALTFVAVETRTGLVEVVRQARLPVRLAQVWGQELVRQQDNAPDYTSAASQVGAMAVLARHRRLTRDNCLAWAELHDMPAPPRNRRRG